MDVRWLGRIDFEHGLALQDEIVRTHSTGGDVLLLLEHEPVYTIGRGGCPDHLPGQRGRSQAPGVPVHRIGRGGDVTYHGPGQLVGYALVDLRARGGDVHRYLRDLEKSVTAVLAECGIRGERCEGRTGVWVSGPRAHRGVAEAGGPWHSTGDRRPRKIASIGIGVRRGISLHGFALNVSVDLATFAPIVPCGIADVEMTSIEAEGVRPVPGLEDVAAIAARSVPAVLAGGSVAADPAGAAR